MNTAKKKLLLTTLCMILSMTLLQASGEEKTEKNSTYQVPTLETIAVENIVKTIKSGKGDLGPYPSEATNFILTPYLKKHQVWKKPATLYFMSPDDIKGTLFDCAIKNPDHVKWLFHTGIDIPNDILHICAQQGALETMRLCIERYNFDVNKEDSYNNTPLHYAYDKADIAELLISHNANVHHRNKYNHQPLDYCLSTKTIVTCPDEIYETTSARSIRQSKLVHNSQFQSENDIQQVIEKLILAGATTKKEVYTGNNSSYHHRNDHRYESLVTSLPRPDNTYTATKFWQKKVYDERKNVFNQAIDLLDERDEMTIEDTISRQTQETMKVTSKRKRTLDDSNLDNSLSKKQKTS